MGFEQTLEHKSRISMNGCLEVTDRYSVVCSSKLRGCNTAQHDTMVMLSRAGGRLCVSTDRLVSARNARWRQADRTEYQIRTELGECTQNEWGNGMG